MAQAEHWVPPADDWYVPAVHDVHEAALAAE
jgi:hypothetical protein